MTPFISISAAQTARLLKENVNTMPQELTSATRTLPTTEFSMILAVLHAVQEVEMIKEKLLASSHSQLYIWLKEKRELDNGGILTQSKPIR